MVTNSYFGLISIILIIVGIILFIVGLVLRKRFLWILGLVISLVCGAFLIWMFSLG